MANELIFEVKPDTKKAEEGLKDFESKAKKSGENAGDSFERGVGVGLGKVKLAIAALGAYISGKFLKDVIEESMQAESAMRLFSASLAQAGNYSKDAVSNFKDFAAALQVTTGVSDDLIIKNAATLASLGQLSGDGLERATKASLDLAAGLQMDVGSAFDLLAKASNGSVGALSRYGIKIDENLSSSEKFSQVLTKIQERFGGLAAAKMDTFEGALTGVKNAFADSAEAMGDFITKSPVVIGFLKTLASTINNATKNMSGGGLFDSILNGAMKAFSFISNYILPVFEMVGRAVWAAARVVKTGFDTILGLAIALGSGLMLAILKPMELILSGMQSINLALGNKAGAESFSGTLSSLRGSIEEFKNSAVASFDMVAESANTTLLAADEVGARFDFSAAAVRFGEDWAAMSAAVAAKGSEIANNSKGTAAKVTADWKQAAVQLAQTFNQYLVGAISYGMQTLGASLVKGVSAFENFEKKILGLMGDMAIKMGEVLLMTGIGIQSLWGLNGAQAIIAGLGLIALGGILKAMSGGEASAGPAGGGVGAAGGGGVAPAPAETITAAPEEEQKPQTNVQVVIQGNVLDRRETGLAIIETLNEHFASNGSVLNPTLAG